MFPKLSPLCEGVQALDAVQDSLDPRLAAGDQLVDLFHVFSCKQFSPEHPSALCARKFPKNRLNLRTTIFWEMANYNGMLLT